MKPLNILFPTILLASMATACSPDFDEVTEVQDFRLLGARTDPADFVFLRHAESQSQWLNAWESFALEVTQDLDVELTLLTADPTQPDGSFDYRIVGCVMDTDLVCEGDSTLLAEGTASLGETKIPLAIPPELGIESLKADPAFGYAGAAIWIRGELTRNETSEIFIKAFLVIPDCEGDRELNENPAIQELLTGDEDAEVPLELNSDGRLAAQVEEEIRLLPVILEDQHQTYEVIPFEQALSAVSCSDSLTLGTEDEKMTVRFYADCGSLSHDRKTEKENKVFETEEDKKEKNLSVTWTAPEETGICTLWFVVDDSRDGVGWTVLETLVQPAPTN